MLKEIEVKCFACGRIVAADDVTVSVIDFPVAAVRFGCCGSVALFRVDPRFPVAELMWTDLLPEEVPAMRGKPAIGTDDVLDAHEALESGAVEMAVSGKAAAGK